MTDSQFALERYFTHYTFHQGGFTLTVLSHKSHFLTPIDGQRYMVEHYLVAIRFLNVLSYHRIITASYSRGKFQPQRRIILFINFDGDNTLQLLDTALYLHGLGRFITETFDKLFGILYLFLLILVRSQLLLAPLLTEFHVLIVSNLVIVDASARDFDGTIGYIINKCPIVTNQHHRITMIRQKSFQPLNTLYVQMVGRLIQQQHIRTLQQQLCQLYTHPPSPAKFRSRPVEIRTLESQSH